MKIYNFVLSMIGKFVSLFKKKEQKVAPQPINIFIKADKLRLEYSIPFGLMDEEQKLEFLSRVRGEDFPEPGITVENWKLHFDSNAFALMDHDKRAEELIRQFGIDDPEYQTQWEAESHSGDVSKYFN